MPPLADKYELTMLAAALRDGTVGRRTTFEVFARRLPEGRRYGITAGTTRFVETLQQFRFDAEDLGSLTDFLDADTLDYLASYQFTGDIDGYPEGEWHFPGSGAPTASLVHKLVEVDGIPVEKRSSNNGSHGGRNLAQRLPKTTGTIVEEVVYPARQPPPTPPDLVAGPLTVPLVRDGEAIAEPGLKAARERVSQGLHSLPWDGLKLSNGDPAIPTRIIAPTRGGR